MWLRICLQCRRPWCDSWVRKICWRRLRLPTPVFWPGEFHELYSPCGCRVGRDEANFHFQGEPVVRVNTDQKRLPVASAFAQYTPSQPQSPGGSLYTVFSSCVFSVLQLDYFFLLLLFLSALCIINWQCQKHVHQLPWT